MLLSVLLQLILENLFLFIHLCSHCLEEGANQSLLLGEHLLLLLEPLTNIALHLIVPLRAQLNSHLVPFFLEILLTAKNIMLLLFFCFLILALA